MSQSSQPLTSRQVYPVPSRQRWFQQIAISLITLGILTGCGGGDDVVQNTVTSPLPPPQDGIRGQVAANISGATITITDANGDEVVVATGRNTGSQGRYDLVFSEFAINAGINTPLVLTLNGAGATAVCDYNADGGDDCLTADGTFAAFGETYELPDNFQLRGILPTLPASNAEGRRTGVVNISAASDLAARYALDQANGEPLTEQLVNQSMQQALGVVEFVSGLTTASVALNDIPIANITNSSDIATPALALALFNGTVHGLVNPDTSNSADYRRTLDRIGTRIAPSPIREDNQLRSTGTFLSSMVTPFLTVASTFQASLTEASAIMAAAIARQTVAIPLLDEIADNPVNIALPAVFGTADPLQRTKVFVNRLNENMGAVLLVSSSASFAGTTTGADTVLTNQISAMRTLASPELRRALIQLDSAIALAAQSNTTNLSGTNVSGLLSYDGDTVNLSSTTSTFSNIQTGISANLTIPEGTRTNPGGNGVFRADMSISVSRSQNNVTTQELYSGVLRLEMAGDGTSADAVRIDYTGDLTAADTLQYQGTLTLTEIQGVDASTTTGRYDAEFTFSSGSSLSMAGNLDGLVETYAVNTGASTVVVDLQTQSITDMNATLNLDIDSSGNVTGGSLTSLNETTGTLGADSIINFVDDTATALPVPII